MDPSLLWAGFIAMASFLGIHGAYHGALAAACLQIGRALAGAGETGTGVQDAITPPSSINDRLLNWLATLLLSGLSWYHLGMAGLAVFLAARLVTVIALGAILKADPPKRHFCRKIYSSMSNREADYVKEGDTIRAGALEVLRGRFERGPYAFQLRR